MAELASGPATSIIQKNPWSRPFRREPLCIPAQPHPQGETVSAGLLFSEMTGIQAQACVGPKAKALTQTCPEWAHKLHSGPGSSCSRLIAPGASAPLLAQAAALRLIR